MRSRSFTTVVIEGTSFHPQSLTVRRGDIIVWKNKDFFPHTVTARNLQFDSHILAEGRSWKYTAKERGEFPYFCMLHPDDDRHAHRQMSDIRARLSGCMAR